MEFITFIVLICITAMTALFRICKCIEAVQLAKSYESCVYYIYGARSNATTKPSVEEFNAALELLKGKMTGDAKKEA